MIALDAKYNADSHLGDYFPPDNTLKDITENLPAPLSEYLSDQDLASASLTNRSFQRCFAPFLNARRLNHEAQAATRVLERITTVQGERLPEIIQQYPTLLSTVKALSLCGRLPHTSANQLKAITQLITLAPNLKMLHFFTEDISPHSLNLLEKHNSPRTPLRYHVHTRPALEARILQAYLQLRSTAEPLKPRFETTKHLQHTRQQRITTAKNILVALGPNIAMVAPHRLHTNQNQALNQGALLVFGLTLALLAFFEHYLQQNEQRIIAQALGNDLKRLTTSQQTYENRLGDLSLTPNTRAEHITRRRHQLAQHRANLLTKIYHLSESLMGTDASRIPQFTRTGEPIPPLLSGLLPQRGQLAVQLENINPDKAALHRQSEKSHHPALASTLLTNHQRDIDLIDKKILEQVNRLNAATQELNENTRLNTLLQEEQNELYHQNGDGLYALIKLISLNAILNYG